MSKSLCGWIGALGVLFTVLQPDAARAQEPPKLLLQGDMSEKPERRLQGKSWKVLRLQTPLPDGNVAYVHVVSPPVPDADYTVLRILYEAFPADAKSIYETYTGAFAANLSLAKGDVVIDFSKGQ